MINFVNKFITVSLNPSTVSEPVLDIVNMVNIHHHTIKEKMCLLMNTYLTHRQMGEAEAVYKMLPDLHFKESNATTFFI